METDVKYLLSLEMKNTTEALKYAYAFMQCKRLNKRECSFYNPTPTKRDAIHIFPRDTFTASYSETDMPEWKIFKDYPAHLSSPGFSCVGCIDKADIKRVVCTFIKNTIIFTCYGDYENEARIVIQDITSSLQNLE